jgi:hypothetical protein
MKNNEQFSEQVLEQTLAAVRHEKQRRFQRRAGIAVGLLAVSLTLLLKSVPNDEKGIAADPDLSSRPENLVVFSTASSKSPEGAVTVFSTRDSVVEVTYISTDEVNEMLGDIPHAFYQTADGKMHFWSSTLAQLL